MNSKQRVLVLGMLSLFNFLVPILGLFANIMYVMIQNLSNNEKKIIYMNIIFSLAFIGFIYFRVNETGDVYRYAISLHYYKLSLINGIRSHIIESLYEMFYPLWYFILYITSKLDFSIQFINFLAGFSIFSSIFYVLYKLGKYFPSKNAETQILVKAFLFLSVISIYSSYKILWAFSFVLLAIFFFAENKKIRAIIFSLLGVGLHPVAWIPLIIYFISTLVKFRKIYIFVTLLLSYTVKPLLLNFLNIPFLGSKINTYVNGEWANYTIRYNEEYIQIFLLLCITIFMLSIIILNTLPKKSANIAFFAKYNNFIFLAFA